MAAVLTPSRPNRTFADVLRHLGDIPPDRVRFHPLPSQATKQDVLIAHEEESVLCELVDGILVEKPMGYRESTLAIVLGSFLHAFVFPRDLGMVSGEAGMMELFPGLVRIPDLAFVAWDRMEGGSVPTDPIPCLVPNLAVEILSLSNTKSEMTRKLGEYFKAGVLLVWIVDPRARTVAVYTKAAQEPLILGEADTLDGGDVLPGFQLVLQDLFGRLDRQPGTP